MCRPATNRRSCPGLAVQIGDVQGTVARLRSADRSGTVVVEAVIAPATPIANATNGTAVKVTLTLQNDAGVLIAPAEALVSTARRQLRRPGPDDRWDHEVADGRTAGCQRWQRGDYEAPTSPMEPLCCCRRSYPQESSTIS